MLGLGWAAPIGVCATDPDGFVWNVTLPTSYTFDCDSNDDVFIDMWFDALSCDGTHTLTTAVYSDDFNCDAASECDYVGIEYYPLDPNDPCTDDVAPTDATPGYIPFVVDPCFSTSYWNEYIFVSDCD
eukprot:505289_1